MVKGSGVGLVVVVGVGGGSGDLVVIGAVIGAWW